MTIELHRELRKTVRETLDSAALWPLDGTGDTLRGDLETLLEGIDALTPEMVRNYAVAVMVMLEALRAKSITIDAGDLAVLAKGGVALDLVWKAHPDWSGAQVIQHLRDTGRLVVDAEPSPDAIRGPAGRA